MKTAKLKNTAQHKSLSLKGNKKLRVIGSRGSDLALWQANFVLAELKKINIPAEIKIIKTQGDIVQDLSWDKMEGKGFFTKEIEDALLRKEIDLAVHSHKDLPTESPKGLIIATVSEREDPSELLLIHKNAVDERQKFSLKQNARVGTSSARRKSQMQAWRNDVTLVDLRGNVPTRIQKLRDKKYDAILIAYAGVSRLEIDLSEFYCEKLDVHEFIPAPAQGVLALQIRQPLLSFSTREKNKDKELFDALRKITHKEVEEVISVERKILNLFEGGCQLPLGVYCEKEQDNDGNPIFKVRVAKAENAHSFPRYFYFESKRIEGLAEKIVRHINLPLLSENYAKSERVVNDLSKKGKLGIGPVRIGDRDRHPSKHGPGHMTVFISRDEKNNDFFKRCLEANGYKVFCQSLIEIKQIPIKKYKKSDWVFFSSKNAVKHFFEQKPDTEGVKFGAVGKTTAEEIRRFGKYAEFIGSPDDTRKTGKKFSALLGSKTVLFPQAKGSMKTIQLQLPKKENVRNVVVYETRRKREEVKWKVEEMNVFVFTSPSNVDTFFEKYNKGNYPFLWKRAGVSFVAMGDATAGALKKNGIKVSKQPASFDDLGLAQAVFGI